MKLYHGTKSNFAEFSIPGNGKHGLGYYFTMDYNEARLFSQTLAGNGEGSEPRVICINAHISNLFDTMNNEHCKMVADFIGLEYKDPKHLGEYGNKEHYNHLSRLLNSNGYSDEQVNQVIEAAGFDGLLYHFSNHVIIFNADLIEILDHHYEL